MGGVDWTSHVGLPGARGPRMRRPLVRRRLVRGLAVSVAAWALVGCGAVETVDRTVRDAARSGDPARPPLVLQGEPEVRVRLQANTTTLSVAGPGRLVARSAGATKTLGSTLTITSGPEGVLVVDERGQRHRFAFGEDVEVLAHDTRVPGGVLRASESLTVNHERLPGFVAVRPRWHDYPNQFDVVGVMALETYLPGVLTGELPKAWPRQAYEAQAVAARTYALHERERARREGRAHDVEDTTTDQVYSAASPTTMALEAVRATRGMVLTERGSVLRAYYSSTCGGRPSSAGAVWPTGPGYEFNRAAPLQGRARPFACQGSTHYRWEVTRSDEDLGQRLRAWGRANNHGVRGIGRVRAIQATGRNDAQRATQYRVTDDAARHFTLTAEELRMACNQGVPGLGALPEGAKVRSGDGEFDCWAGTVHVRGRGWGHGVGLCQWCAKGLAEQGMDWREMVGLFYPGAEVTKAY